MPALPTHIKAEITLHYDGPRGEVNAGYRVRDVTTSEILAMGAMPVEGPAGRWRTTEDVLRFVEETVRRHLSPF